ncbi:MAG: flavocytochrome c [Clostridia bacterium]|nr:flavocytochrome c [Clostridia bacterium]
MKKLASILIALLMLAGLMTGAFADDFTGTAMGNGGDVVVTLTVEDGKIVAATVVGEQETKGIAYEQCADGTFAGLIVEAQGAEFDAIAGATVTSNAVKAATLKAMEAAGLAEAQAVVVEDVTCDVVIVGAGGAGMSAALQAIDSGVESVIVVEKGGSTGGNTSRATGGMNAAKTAAQDANEWKDATTTAVEATIAKAKAAAYADKIADLTAKVEEQFEAYKANPTGYFDSTELFALDTIVGGSGINDVDLVMTMVNGSAEAIDWLATKNADLVSVGSFGGASVMRIHRALTAEGKTTPVGAYLVKTLTAEVEAVEKIDLRLNTAATEIVVTDGKVTGVKVSSEHGDYTINAKAVILASGGFGADLERVAAYQPSLDGFVTTNALTVTGDGIDMAVAIGAATVDMEQIQIHPSVYTETAALITEGIRGDGAILVNQGGKRFVNELETRNVVSAAELAQEGGYAWTIVDQKMMDASATYAGYYTKGFALKGETIAELAAAMGTDAAVLEETLNTWNAALAAQNDAEFGRLSFANALDTAPFYAIKVAPGIHHTMGGLKINTAAEVLTEAGEAIPGLFAAGEITGGVHGGNRLGGNAVCDIVVYGRIAAQSAAAYIAE